MKKQITIDARWLKGGIGTYTEHLLEGLSKSRNGFEIEAITRPEHVDLVTRWCSKVRIVDAPIYSLSEQWALPRVTGGSDLLHVPHFNVPLFHRGQLLVSILDVIHLTDPAYKRNLAMQIYARPMLLLAARKANHIVTISEFSKSQIIEHLRVPEDKVTAIRCGVNGQFHCEDRAEAARTITQQLRIEPPYILYVGNLKPHKNVPVLLRAFANLRARGVIPHRLVILGDDKRTSRALVDESANLGIGDATTFLPYVPPQILPKLYAAASLLVMPSRVEGFGLPVLEAMAAGTPVICSRAASLPEVAGDAAVYFDLASPDHLAAAIEAVLNSAELQKKLREKGLLRAKKLSWQSSVQKHVEVYEKVLSET
jgi:glycosyltransferase involved in cell wall biosynthesis